MIPRFICLFVILITITSCAGKKLWISRESTELKPVTPDAEPEYTVYLIGDAGNAPAEGTTAVFRYLAKTLEEADQNSTIVWLGDNIYPVGLAPESDPDHDLGRHRIQSQLDCLQAYSGKIYFIPGNHDWYRYGAEGLKRQERMIEQNLSARANTDQDSGSYFLPDSACGKIHSIALDNNRELILMDSNWFLMEDRGDLSHCPESERKPFLEALRKAIRKNEHKQLIIGLHHPPYTYGSHGSRFKFKDYFFPLTQLKEGLYLPLPFSGIIFNQMRAYLTEQDARHYAYSALRELLEEELTGRHASSIVASGHEHNLQYIRQNDIHYIVSGAGSKSSAVGTGPGSIFAATKKGWAELRFYRDSFELRFIVPRKDGHSADIVFKQGIPLKINENGTSK